MFHDDRSFPEMRFTRPTYPEMRATRPTYPEMRASRPTYPEMRDTRPNYPEMRATRPTYPEVNKKREAAQFQPEVLICKYEARATADGGILVFPFSKCA
jgi:hypothetical protein